MAPQPLQVYWTGSAGCPSFVSGSASKGGPCTSIPHPRSESTVVIATPVGQLSLSGRDGLLASIGFATDTAEEKPPGIAILDAAALQLCRYFEDPETRFSLPLNFAGTTHMRRVWIALTEIPPGRTETYGGLARSLGSGPRAVAAACRANAFVIVIPCHRVVSAHGLGGYCGQRAGPMLEIKRWLLRHEGCACD